MVKILTIISPFFKIQLQLAEKDKEINCLASFLENLSREKVLSAALAVDSL